MWQFKSVSLTYGSAASAWCAVWSWAKWSFLPDHRRFCRERSPQPRHYWWVTRNKSLNTHQVVYEHILTPNVYRRASSKTVAKKQWCFRFKKSALDAKGQNVLPNHQAITLKNIFNKKELISLVFGWNVILRTPNPMSHTVFISALQDPLQTIERWGQCVYLWQWCTRPYLSKSSSSSSSAMAHWSSSSRSTIIASIWGTEDTTR